MSVYEVGKFYRVPCVLGQLHDLSDVVWWPIIGPSHEDSAIVRFPHEHYHFDYRFLGKHSLRRITSKYSVFATVLTRIHSDVQLRRRECYRQYPEYPFRRAMWINQIHEAYANKTLSASRICPHRGADLSTFAPDADGCITCPLHGLRWDAASGKCRPPNLTLENTGAA